MRTTPLPEAIDQHRRYVLATAAGGFVAAAAASLFPLEAATAASTDAIRPFRVKVPEKDLVDLRRRLLAARWADAETVPDQSQGVQLATVRKLVRYWADGYDWRRFEGK